jgi:hypothetical protein
MAALLAAFPCAAHALPIDPVLAPETLWSGTASALVEAHAALGLHWNSSAHDLAESTAPGATLFGLRVYQTVLRFDGETPKEAAVLFYNRGDAEAIDKAAYEALVRQTVEAISTATGVKFTPRGKDAGNAVKAEGLLWNTAASTYLLEYSCTREVKSQGIPFRAEFIRLTITPKAQPQGLLVERQKLQAAPRAAFRGEDHVVRDATSGDVMLKDIPMVDQGEKGYCVVASAERVLRYYGIRADGNELAQLANTSASGGTSVEAMTGVLKKLTARLKIRTRTVEEADVKSLLATINDYNRFAKQAKATTISTSSPVLDVQAIYGQMDAGNPARRPHPQPEQPLGV